MPTLADFYPKTPHTEESKLKKFAVLMGLAILALIVDGTMSYDIFDSHPETIKVWLVLGLIVLVGLVIVIADSSKTDHDRDNSE